MRWTQAPFELELWVVRSFRLFLRIDMILKKCFDTLVMFWNHLKNFFIQLKHNPFRSFGQFLISSGQKLIFKPLWPLKNNKKSPTAHVYGEKTRTKHRVMIQPNSTDRYDPEEWFWYLGYVLKRSRKFFHRSWSQRPRSLSQILQLMYVKILLQITENCKKLRKINRCVRFLR